MCSRTNRRCWSLVRPASRTHTMTTAWKPTGTHSIPSLRWWIAGILFASTVINYVDRQTLSLLAPYLKLQYRWTNSDYANLVIGFRIAYSEEHTSELQSRRDLVCRLL